MYKRQILATVAIVVPSLNVLLIITELPAFTGTSLHDAEPQQDCADGFDGAEHKVAQIVDGRQRIICKGRHGHNLSLIHI